MRPMESAFTAVGATNDRMREPMNWGLVACLLGCVAFWGVVVLGLVAAV